MQIKNSSTHKNSVQVIIAIVALLALSFLLLRMGADQKASDNEKTTASENDLNEATVIPKVSYHSLFSTSDYALYKDSDLSVYLTQDAAVPKLVYVYNDEPEGRSLTDNFFLHIYIKDSTKLKRKAAFAIADFVQKPQPLVIDGKTYYIFQRNLTSSNYKESFIPLDNIAYINTGRFKPKIGRSLDLKKLDPSKVPQTQLNNGLDKITVEVSQKKFKKIEQKRARALNNGILISKDGDLIDGTIQLNNKIPQEVEFRLKGDWTDHLKHDRKWSYRFIMKGESTFKGMRKFSIQHPVVRNYLWEWLFNKAAKQNGLIGLRYDFAEVHLTTKDNENREIPMGIMAVEEAFDKILIENNKKREGIIIGFDESLIWSDRSKQRALGLQDKTQSKELHGIQNAPIKVYNETKVLSDPKLSNQFNTAKSMLQGLREGKFTISEVFDTEKLSTFVALTNLFGGYHGLIWHNLRIYYNPITNKLEPVSFDSNSGTRIDKILQYPLSKNDSLFQKKLRSKLALVSSTNFIHNLVNKNSQQFEQLKKSLFTEYGNTFDSSILEHNSNFIKKKLNPAMLITAGLLSHQETHMSVEVNNVSGFPVLIDNLLDKEGRLLSKNKKPTRIPAKETVIVHFELSNYFVNAFVSKKNKKGNFQYPKDVSKLRIAHKIEGVDFNRTTTIKPYGQNQNLDTRVTHHRVMFQENYTDFPFIEVTSDSTLLFKEGNYLLNKDLVIPPHKKTIVAAGFTLDLSNKASLRSSSALVAQGTQEKPIRFLSSDGTGNGIFISDAQALSKLDYCIFDNLSNPKNDMWSVSGAVNFHESDVSISHTTFSNNRCEDGLNIIRSKFLMTDTTFTGTQSDAFDGDFVSGTLDRCTFVNAGNDGIDVSGSDLIITNISIDNPADKGISAGENSTITGENIKVTGGEIGVVSKDLSTVMLKKVTITNTRLGLSAFQKKSEYGVASIDINMLSLTNVQVAHLIEVNSLLRIDKVPVETVSNKVIDQMYGKEYGKSSK